MDGGTVQAINLFLNFGWPILLLMTAYFIGNVIERNHFRRIRKREAEYQSMPVVAFDTMPEDWEASDATLATGSNVGSLDYFKRILAALRNIDSSLGDRLLEDLDRARREAVLRMIESAREQGFDGIYNVRLETSRLANSRGDGQGTAGVEMLAFGTAVKIASRFAPGARLS